MNKDERKQKIAEFNENLKNFGDKVKDCTDTVTISGM